jgi:putative tryptophan/tyrosine transport system substrate-binding protein
VNRRRALLRALAAGALIAGASPARTQHQTRVPRVGVLYFGARENVVVAGLPLFRQRLRELGYVEGKTILIEDRFADGNEQRLNELARELVDSRVDVIVASAVAAAAAARQATGTIPIVMLHAGNPIGAGLIASLARPGGNVTGTANLLLGDKQLELIRQLVPRIAKLAVLVNPTNAGADPIIANITDAARSFRIGVVVVEVSRAEDFPGAFSELRRARPDALMVLVEPMIGSNSKQIIDFAASARLPAVYDFGGMARRGGLISYSPVVLEHYTLAADYVDKILKGAKPADLPVQQPSKFELVINMKTAKELGLTIPQSLLLRADEVIQ